jgi:hypothetical protein
MATLKIDVSLENLEDHEVADLDFMSNMANP